MKAFEVTIQTKVILDEGILDDFKAFANSVIDMASGDDTSKSTTAPANNGNNTNNTQSTIDTAVDAAKKKIAPADANANTAQQTTQPQGNNWERKNQNTGETAESFKRWLRADGPGREKFGGKQPSDYTAAMTRLLGQGYPLRALEVYKLWGAKSNITPQALAQIKSAAADQAKEIGL